MEINKTGRDADSLFTAGTVKVCEVFAYATSTAQPAFVGTNPIFQQVMCFCLKDMALWRKRNLFGCTVPAEKRLY